MTIDIAKKMQRKYDETLRMRGHYRDTFTSGNGLKVLRHIMKEGFAIKSTFVAGDPQQTALNEGSRRLALSIARHVFRDEADILIQLEEMQQEE